MTTTVVNTGPRRITRSVDVQAPAAELFAIVADPRRHHELDGSGTVLNNVFAPAEMLVGSEFSTKMRKFGAPYTITSTVTALKRDELIEWQHPLGHRWRWELAQLGPGVTRVTETFDYHDAGRLKNALRFYELAGYQRQCRGYRSNPDEAAQPASRVTGNRPRFPTTLPSSLRPVALIGSHNRTAFTDSLAHKQPMKEAMTAQSVAADPEESHAEVAARFGRDALPWLDVLFRSARRMTVSSKDAENLVQRPGLRIYVRDFTSGEDAGVTARVLVETFGQLRPPASTWIGVATLAQPEYLVEVETFAVVPEYRLIEP